MTKDEIKQIEINVDWLCSQLDFYESLGIKEKEDHIKNLLFHEINKLNKNEIRLSTENLVQ